MYISCTCAGSSVAVGCTAGAAGRFFDVFSPLFFSPPIGENKSRKEEPVNRVQTITRINLALSQDFTSPRNARFGRLFILYLARRVSVVGLSPRQGEKSARVIISRMRGKKNVLFFFHAILSSFVIFYVLLAPSAGQCKSGINYNRPSPAGRSSRKRR